MDKSACHRLSAQRSATACVLFVALVGCFDPPPPRGGTTDAATSTGTGDAELDGDASTSGADPDDSTDDGSSGEGPGLSTSGDETGYDTGAPVPCGSGDGLCAAVPAEWNGPVTLDVAATDVGAQCGRAAEAFRAHGDIDVPEATCDCECTAATGAECSEAVLTAWAGDASCSETDVFVQNLSPAGDSCNFTPAVDATGTVPLSEASFWTLATESSGGSCTAQAEVDIQPARYGSEVAGCDVDPLEGTCGGDETCVDASQLGELCIWREGDHACPGGNFSERTVYFTGGLLDDRSCSTCSCGAVITTRSTLCAPIHLDVCSSCHPFYTGKQKVLDTGGRIERFKARFGAVSSK